MCTTARAALEAKDLEISSQVRTTRRSNAQYTQALLALCSLSMEAMPDVARR